MVYATGKQIGVEESPKSIEYQGELPINYSRRHNRSKHSQKNMKRGKVYPKVDHTHSAQIKEKKENDFSLESAQNTPKPIGSYQNNKNERPKHHPFSKENRLNSNSKRRRHKKKKSRRSRENDRKESNAARKHKKSENKTDGDKNHRNFPKRPKKRSRHFRDLDSRRKLFESKKRQRNKKKGSNPQI